jgi:hypothetical protein
MNKDKLLSLADVAETSTVTTMRFDEELFRALDCVTHWTEKYTILEVRWPTGDQIEFNERLGPRPPSTCLTAAYDLHRRLLPDHRWNVAHPGYNEGIYQEGKTRVDIYHPLSSGGSPRQTAFGWTPSLAWIACILKMQAWRMPDGSR